MHSREVLLRLIGLTASAKCSLFHLPLLLFHFASPVQPFFGPEWDGARIVLLLSLVGAVEVSMLRRRCLLAPPDSGSACMLSLFFVFLRLFGSFLSLSSSLQTQSDSTTIHGYRSVGYRVKGPIAGASKELANSIKCPMCPN